MNTEERTTEYAVDLTRDEYVRSQEILQTRHRMVNPRIITLVLLIFCVASAFPNVFYNGEIDWSMLFLLGLLVLSEIWVMITLPAKLRRRNEQAYDATVYAGYSFVGTVLVEEDAVRKRTATATAVIPYEQCRLFVETADMMIFCGMDGKCIAIPSRFLTEKTAAITRQAALSHLAPMQCVHLASAQATASEETPFTWHTEPETEDVLLTVNVEYTDNELVGLATDMTMEDFYEALPNKCLLMTVVATVGYFLLAAHPLPVFLLGMMILFLFAVIKTRVKMRRVITETERGACFLRVEFTEKAVRLIGDSQHVKPLQLPWSHITRAVDCRHTVELYTGKTRQLVIPKRNITNFEELSAVVDSHMA